MENREIKFRAFDKRYRKMINNIHEIDPSFSSGPQIYFFNKYLEDDNFEVMQFVGLKDKDGKEIYEGDILDFPHKLEHEDGIVKWIGNGFWLETLAEVNNHHWPNEDNCKIIGNIREP